MAPTRSAREVFDSHLALREDNRFEEDLATNYAEDVVVLTLTGVFRGHDGLRASHADLQRYLPDGRYAYKVRLVEGDVAYLAWSGRSAKGTVHDGADSFVIREGKIVAQTIHYTVDSQDDA